MIESDHRPSYIEVQLDAIANLEQVIEPCLERHRHLQLLKQMLMDMVLLQ